MWGSCTDCYHRSYYCPSCIEGQPPGHRTLMYLKCGANNSLCLPLHPWWALIPSGGAQWDDKFITQFRRLFGREPELCRLGTSVGLAYTIALLRWVVWKREAQGSEVLPARGQFNLSTGKGFQKIMGEGTSQPQLYTTLGSLWCSQSHQQCSTDRRWGSCIFREASLS